MSDRVQEGSRGDNARFTIDDSKLREGGDKPHVVGAYLQKLDQSLTGAGGFPDTEKLLKQLGVGSESKGQADDPVQAAIGAAGEAAAETMKAIKDKK